MANVREVEWQGGIYPIADEVARGEAQQARSLANTAQDTANTAQTTATNAQTTADVAQTTATNAQTAISSLNTRVSSIENTLEVETFQIPLSSGLVPLEGDNIGAKSGNIVTITIGIRSYPIPDRAIIATLPEGARPKMRIIVTSISGDWKVDRALEILPSGDIRLYGRSDAGLYFSTSFIV